ncbi:MAG: MBL fold metallo-hydrolase [Candidatus Thorarchaeota archaeon]
MQTFSWDWLGNNLRVKVLYSYAGVATQILVNDIETDFNLLMDVGDGILRDLLHLPKKFYENIQLILITHGHFDHIGGLYSLLAFFRMINRTKKLTILCPKKVIELQGIINTFQNCYSNSLPYQLDVKEIDSKLNFNSLTVTPFPVKHRGSIIGKKTLPSIPAYGYVLQKDTEKVVYTGDTGYFKELENVINNADFALIEGTNTDKKTDYHLSIDEANKLGKLTKSYCVIHKILPRYD